MEDKIFSYSSRFYIILLRKYYSRTLNLMKLIDFSIYYKSLRVLSFAWLNRFYILSMMLKKINEIETIPAKKIKQNKQMKPTK